MLTAEVKEPIDSITTEFKRLFEALIDLATGVAVVPSQREAEVGRTVHAHHHLRDWHQHGSRLTQRHPQLLAGLQTGGRQNVRHKAGHVIQTLKKMSAGRGAVYGCCSAHSGFLTSLLGSPNVQRPAAWSAIARLSVWNQSSLSPTELHLKRAFFSVSRIT